MRRILLAALIGCAVLPTLTAPALAKGEHARIVIEGSGLARPIVLSGDGAVLYMAGSGTWELKWDVPNIGGTLKPNADLGPAYTATVRERCGPTKVKVYRQTLYPEAPDGLQVLTPPGASGCFGEATPGYWPAATELSVLLAHRGLPASATSASEASPSQAGAAAGDGGGGGSTGFGLAVVSLAGGALLLAAGLALVLARRRAAGKPAPRS